jgi:signal transduction histidine kinase
MQMIAKNGIGWVHMEMDQNAEALKWFFRALQTSDNIVYHQKNSNIYSNIAAICIATHKNDSADYFVRKAIVFSEKDDNIFFLANSLNILANNYIKTKRPALAKVPLERALKIREQIGDPFYIVSDLSQLALFYAEQSLPAKGIEASLHGIEIAKKYKLFSKLPFLQLGLAKNFKAAGDYLKYGETIEKVLSLKDSVYQLNSEVELAEIRTRYNQQKQENIIIQQQLALNRKNTVLYVAFITVFFAVILTLLLFNNYKRKQRSIVEKIKEEEKRKAKQAVRAAEENERRRISADLHDNLGAYASAISANVDDLVTEYGSINDSAIINIKNNADDIINSLSETIWVLNKTEILITSISDRFKIYVSKIRDAYPEFSININENIITNTTLSPEASLNLLRIMQEAFHNAIKHSRGDSITVEIISDSKIEISIMDNGKGFTNKMGHDGNGIRNMQQRAKANGWYLKIKRLKPTGTAVELGS